MQEFLPKKAKLLSLLYNSMDPTDTNTTPASGQDTNPSPDSPPVGSLWPGTPVTPSTPPAPDITAPPSEGPAKGSMSSVPLAETPPTEQPVEAPQAPTEPVPVESAPPETFTIGQAPTEPSPQPQAPEPPPPGPPASPENPFIPQGVVPEVGKNGQPKPPKTGGSFPRRIIMIIAFLVLALGLFAGGRFAFGLFAGPKEVTLTYWGLWENDSVITGIITDFQAKNPKIKIAYSKQSVKQYRERLQAAIDRGEGPDIYRYHSTWIPMLKNYLATVPTTVMTASEFSSTFYKVASRDLVAGQTIFGLPLEIDGLGLYYNEDLFAAAGVTPPTTWEEVLNIVPKLTVKNDTTITTSAIALGTTNNIENFSDIVGTMMMQNGANLTNPVGKEAEEALIFYKKFSNPADPVYTWNDTLDNSFYAFSQGKVAMILAPSWRVFDIKQISPNLRFKIVPIPQLPGSTVTWASYWVEGVSSKTKNQEQAWTFLKYLTSRDVMTKLYSEEAKTRLFGEPYSRVDLGSSISSDPYVGAYIKQAPDAHSFPLASRTFDNGINDKLSKYIEDAINGMSAGSAPTAVLQTAASGFGQVLSTYGLITSTHAAGSSTQ